MSDSEALLAALASAFAFPTLPHQRRHAPGGYTDYRSYKRWLRDDFHYRCAYCLTREQWEPAGSERFGVDHYIADTKDTSLATDYANLIFACNRCNTLKREFGDGIVLKPCGVALADHLTYTPDGEIQHCTREGKAHIRLLRLDAQGVTYFRRRLIRALRSLAEAGDASAIAEWLGYPADLEDLRDRRPPANAKPEGIAQSAFEQRRRGTLPRIY